MMTKSCRSPGVWTRACESVLSRESAKPSGRSLDAVLSFIVNVLARIARVRRLLGVRLLRFQEAMDMDHKIAHLRVINAGLRGAFPGVVSLLVVRIEADNVEFGHVLELRRFGRDDLSAENKMKQLPVFVFVHLLPLPRYNSPDNFHVSAASFIALTDQDGGGGRGFASAAPGRRRSSCVELHPGRRMSVHCRPCR